MKDINALIETLRGTCLSLNEGCQQHGFTEDDLTEQDTAAIDAEIFLCPRCSWWCDQDEANESDDGDVCNDCSSDD